MSQPRIKKTNRGEAIEKNTGRIHNLAQQIQKLADIVRESRRELHDETMELTDVFTDFEEEVNSQLAEISERLDLLERSVWRKIMDKVREIKSGGDPAEPMNRAVRLDIHSVRQDAHDRIKKEGGDDDEKDAGEPGEHSGGSTD